MATLPEDLITVARIARPQGIRGEVIADLLTDFPERFANLGKVRVGWPNGDLTVVELERARPHQGRILLKFKGCDSRDEAEKLRDVRLLVTREQLVRLPADTYYDFDLVDCVVSTATGLLVGKVVGVQNFGAAPLLVVNDDEKRERLIPLASSICTVVDITHKRIVIEPPEGLLDL
jgi:16S rRNA processing protein RimM